MTPYKSLLLVVEEIIDAGHMNHEDLARLRAAWESCTQPTSVPKRLTHKQIKSLFKKHHPDGWMFFDADKDYIRAIETEVRKKFGVKP